MTTQPKTVAELREIAENHGSPLSNEDGPVHDQAVLAIDELARRAEANERLRDAILWALGENGEFRLGEVGEGAFWWRKELRRRAGEALTAAPSQEPKETTVTTDKPYNPFDGLESIRQIVNQVGFEMNAGYLSQENQRICDLAVTSICRVRAEVEANQVCCGDFSECKRPCVERGRKQLEPELESLRAKLAASEADAKRVAVEELTKLRDSLWRFDPVPPSAWDECVSASAMGRSQALNDVRSMIDKSIAAITAPAEPAVEAFREAAKNCTGEMFGERAGVKPAEPAKPLRGYYSEMQFPLSGTVIYRLADGSGEVEVTEVSSEGPNPNFPDARDMGLVGAFVRRRWDPASITLTLVRAAAEASQDLAEAVALLRAYGRIGPIEKEFHQRLAALLAKHPEQP